MSADADETGDAPYGITKGEYLRELRRVAAEHGRANCGAMNLHGKFSGSPAQRLFGGMTNARIAAGLLADTPEALVLADLREQVEPGAAEYLTSGEIGERAGLSKRLTGQTMVALEAGEGGCEADGLTVERWAKTPPRWRVER